MSGLIVGLVVIYADGGRQDDVKSAEKIAEMAVQVAKMNQTLLMVCDQVEQKNRTLEDLRERVTRLEMRAR